MQVSAILNCKYTFLSAVFYYSLANITPQYRSSLNTIQLVTLVKSVDVSLYGVDKILQPFMDDLAKLEKVLISTCTYRLKLVVYYLN